MRYMPDLLQCKNSVGNCSPYRKTFLLFGLLFIQFFFVFHKTLLLFWAKKDAPKCARNYIFSESWWQIGNVYKRPFLLLGIIFISVTSIQKVTPPRVYSVSSGWGNPA